MTATLAQQLDELMGKNRNVAPGENALELRWDDSDVCKHFLVDFCPHELFTNTKSDLGACSKTHDIGFKQEYQQSSRFQRMGYEDDFLGFLQKMQSDMDKKIRRHMDRLKLTQGGGPDGDGDDLTNEGRLEKKMGELTEKINEYLAKAEALGAEGKVDESVEAIRVADRYKTEREAARKSLNMMMGMEEADTSRPMEVCMVCGCFLTVGDTPQRINDHMNGRQHVGFAKVRATVEELMTKREAKREKERAEREARRKEAEEKKAALAETVEADKEKEKESEDKERRKSRDRDGAKSRDRDRDGLKSSRDRDRRRDGRDRVDRDRGDRDRRRDDRDRDRYRGGDRDRHRGGDRDRDRRRDDRHRGGDRDRERDRRRSRHDRSRSRDDRKRSRYEEEEAEDRLERPTKTQSKSKSPSHNGNDENTKDSSDKSSGERSSGNGAAVDGETTTKEVKEEEKTEEEAVGKTEDKEESPAPSKSEEGTGKAEPESGATKRTEIMKTK